MDIWDKKYHLKDLDGNPVDGDINGTYMRVATALANVEKTEDLRDYWRDRFFWAMQNGAIPGGRITSNSGSEKYKPSTSAINCTVSGRIDDSMDGIMRMAHEAALTLKAGCGIGYEFSTLRPKNAFVQGAGAYTSGPMSFMDIYDKMCFTVSSAGGRRGAQMGTFDVSHPDVRDFIKAKREDGRLRQFNLSLLIDDAFMAAVKSGSDWALVFPMRHAEASLYEMPPASDVSLEAEVLRKDGSGAPVGIVWKEWSSTDGYWVRQDGMVACRVYSRVPACNLWDMIMASTYDYAEPGFLLIDRVNEDNNMWWCENIRASNPCGEIPLPAYGCCLLGSVNLTLFVRDPFTARASFDWEHFREVVSVFSRMLDNVVEVSGLPLAQQQAELDRKRRHGMGYIGIGSAISMLRMSYGDADSVQFVEDVTRELAYSGWKASLDLSVEKGPAPIMLESFKVTEEMLRKRPEMVADGYSVGDEIRGSVLHAKYSRYMQKIAEIDPVLIERLAEQGARYSHHTAIAPTGTIALSLANNASNGIEPSFAHHYSRNVIREGKKSKEKVDVFSFELLAYRHFVNPDAMPFSDDPVNALPDYFVSSDTITPEQHVDIQAAAQKWIDQAISKTINVGQDYPYEDFKDIYMYAYDKGLKGCTTFRFNPAAFSGVLVKEQDLANTTYLFTLENGEQVQVQGNEMIEYDGEMHTASNLFDALKEGYYGKF